MTSFQRNAMASASRFYHYVSLTILSWILSSSLTSSSPPFGPRHLPDVKIENTGLVRHSAGEGLTLSNHGLYHLRSRESQFQKVTTISKNADSVERPGGTPWHQYWRRVILPNQLQRSPLLTFENGRSRVGRRQLTNKLLFIKESPGSEQQFIFLQRPFNDNRGAQGPRKEPNVVPINILVNYPFPDRSGNEASLWYGGRPEEHFLWSGNRITDSLNPDSQGQDDAVWKELPQSSRRPWTPTGDSRPQKDVDGLTDDSDGKLELPIDWSDKQRVNRNSWENPDFYPDDGKVSGQSIDSQFNQNIPVPPSELPFVLGPWADRERKAEVAAPSFHQVNYVERGTASPLAIDSTPDEVNRNARDRGYDRTAEFPNQEDIKNARRNNQDNNKGSSSNTKQGGYREPWINAKNETRSNPDLWRNSGGNQGTPQKAVPWTNQWTNQEPNVPIGVNQWENQEPNIPTGANQWKNQGPSVPLRANQWKNQEFSLPIGENQLENQESGVPPQTNQRNNQKIENYPLTNNAINSGTTVRSLTNQSGYQGRHFEPGIEQSADKDPWINQGRNSEPRLEQLTDKDPWINQRRNSQPRFEQLTDKDHWINRGRNSESRIEQLTNKDPWINQGRNSEPRLEQLTDNDPWINRRRNSEPRIEQLVDKDPWINQGKRQQYNTDPWRNANRKPGNNGDINLDITRNPINIQNQTAGISTDNRPITESFQGTNTDQYTNGGNYYQNQRTDNIGRGFEAYPESHLSSNIQINNGDSTLESRDLVSNTLPLPRAGDSQEGSRSFSLKPNSEAPLQLTAQSVQPAATQISLARTPSPNLREQIPPTRYNDHQGPSPRQVSVIDKSIGSQHSIDSSSLSIRTARTLFPSSGTSEKHVRNVSPPPTKNRSRSPFTPFAGPQETIDKISIHIRSKLLNEPHKVDVLNAKSNQGNFFHDNPDDVQGQDPQRKEGNVTPLPSLFPAKSSRRKREVTPQRRRQSLILSLRKGIPSPEASDSQYTDKGFAREPYFVRLYNSRFGPYTDGVGAWERLYHRGQRTIALKYDDDVVNSHNKTAVPKISEGSKSGRRTLATEQSQQIKRGYLQFNAATKRDLASASEPQSGRSASRSDLKDPYFQYSAGSGVLAPTSNPQPEGLTVGNPQRGPIFQYNPISGQLEPTSIAPFGSLTVDNPIRGTNFHYNPVSGQLEPISNAQFDNPLKGTYYQYNPTTGSQPVTDDNPLRGTYYQYNPTTETHSVTDDNPLRGTYYQYNPTTGSQPVTDDNPLRGTYYQYNPNTGTQPVTDDNPLRGTYYQYNPNTGTHSVTDNNPLRGTYYQYNPITGSQPVTDDNPLRGTYYQYNPTTGTHSVTDNNPLRGTYYRYNPASVTLSVTLNKPQRGTYYQYNPTTGTRSVVDDNRIRGTYYQYNPVSEELAPTTDAESSVGTTLSSLKGTLIELNPAAHPQGQISYPQAVGESPQNSPVSTYIEYNPDTQELALVTSDKEFLSHKNESFTQEKRNNYLEGYVIRGSRSQELTVHRSSRVQDDEALPKGKVAFASQVKRGSSSPAQIAEVIDDDDDDSPPSEAGTPSINTDNKEHFPSEIASSRVHSYDKGQMINLRNRDPKNPQDDDDVVVKRTPDNYDSPDKEGYVPFQLASSGESSSELQVKGEKQWSTSPSASYSHNYVPFLPVVKPGSDLFLRMFREGEIYMDGDAVVQNFYTNGDYNRMLRHFRALPLDNVRFQSGRMAGHLEGYHVTACGTCGPSREPMIEFLTLYVTSPREVRRFLYASKDPDKSRTSSDVANPFDVSQDYSTLQGTYLFKNRPKFEIPTFRNRIFEDISAKRQLKPPLEFRI